MILLWLACASTPSGGDTEMPGDSAPVDDSAALDDSAAPQGEPWDDPEWWTLDNAGLDIMLEDIPESTFEVLFYSSSDGQTWEESPLSPIAWGMSTLGLFSNDVGLAVTGFPEQRVIDAPTDLRSMYGITTTDLEHWGLRRWPLKDDETEGHDILVDPQVELGEDAQMRVWFYIFEMGEDDPAFIPGDHDMCVARFEGDEVLRYEGCPLSEEHLADPSPLMQDGQRLVATTEETAVTVWDLDTGERRSSFEGTVPFLTTWPQQDERWRIAYQVFGDQPGSTLVRMVESEDQGLTWSEPQAPLGDDLSCTSVVVGRFHDTDVLFCARYRGDRSGGGRRSGAG